MTRDSGPAEPSAGRALAAGTGRGGALVLDEPLSFWGGVDPATGSITDRRHPQGGQSVRGRVLVMPSGRGSSSSSSILAETIRAGTGPAAVLLSEADPILAVGSIVAAELYDLRCPVGVLSESWYASVRTGQRLAVTARADGSLVVRRAG